MNNARLRRYHTVRDFFKGVGDMIVGFRSAGKSRKLPASFAEKIMLAVTGVNECAYCSFLHTQNALASGVAKNEIDAILGGVFDEVLPEEVPALLYAQHWADTYGKVTVAAKKKLVDSYGEDMASQIEKHTRIVYLGNMCSNTVVFFEDKTIDRVDKAGTFPVYLLCKPIASSIRNNGMKKAEAVKSSSAKT
jgi:AhpD family alkylhydroperoxidase